ncbi:MAG: helix-turn-helix transcriptional regulator [Clostridia bacterium]
MIEKNNSKVNNSNVLKDRIKNLHAIKEKKEGKKILYEEISEETGISLSTIKKVFADKYPVNLKSEIITKFVEYYKVSYDYLVGWSETMNPKYHNIYISTGLSQKTVECLMNEKGKISCDETGVIASTINLLCEKKYLFEVCNLINKYLISEFETEISEKVSTSFKSIAKDTLIARTKNGGTEWISNRELHNIYLFELQNTLMELRKSIIEGGE